MKKIDITSQISGIDPKFIEEAVNHKVKRISAVRVVAIAACLALLVTSIPLAVLMSREKATPYVDEVKPNHDGEGNNGNKESFRVVYCNSSDMDSMKEIAEQNGLDVVIKDSQAMEEKYKEKTFDSKVEDLTGIPASLNLEIQGKEYVFYLEKDQIMQTYLATESNVEEIRRFGYKATYYAEAFDQVNSNTPYANRISLKYNYVSDDIMGLSFIDKEMGRWKEIVRDTDNKYSVDDLINISRDCIKSIYGDFNFSFDSEPLVTESYKYPGEYSIVFEQRIFGFITGYRIVVNCNIYGELLSINKTGENTLDLYDYYCTNISEEQIEEAQRVALALLDGKKPLKTRLSINIVEGTIALVVFYKEYSAIIVEIPKE